jgi:hypothetical protein
METSPRRRNGRLFPSRCASSKIEKKQKEPEAKYEYQSVTTNIHLPKHHHSRQVVCMVVSSKITQGANENTRADDRS